LLHTLGNLTIVTQDWNSQLSNSSYDVKREKLAKHGLLLNQRYFGEFAPEIWNGKTIRKRAQWLMAMITEIWPQLGETTGSWEEKPKAVIILDEVYPVKSWRDVLRRTADFVVDWSDKEQFEQEIVAALPSYIVREPPNDKYYQLANGWWIYINLNAVTLKQFSTDLIEAAGIPEDEYDVELW